jgi:hypothetical protein
MAMQRLPFLTSTLLDRTSQKQAFEFGCADGASQGSRRGSHVHETSSTSCHERPYGNKARAASEAEGPGPGPFNGHAVTVHWQVHLMLATVTQAGSRELREMHRPRLREARLGK